MKYSLPVKVSAYWEIEIPDNVTNEDEQEQLAQEMFMENQRQGVIIDPDLNPKEAEMPDY